METLVKSVDELAKAIGKKIKMMGVWMLKLVKSKWILNCRNA
ncbi:Vsp/OspC family lipoprotein [Borrelia miyamotoi]